LGIHIAWASTLIRKTQDIRLLGRHAHGAKKQIDKKHRLDRFTNQTDIQSGQQNRSGRSTDLAATLISHAHRLCRHTD